MINRNIAIAGGVILLFVVATSPVAARQRTATKRPPAKSEKRNTTSEEITGRVTTEQNQPVQGATITAGPVGTAGPNAAFIFRSAESGPDGNFAIDGLTPGLYTVKVALPGFVAASGALEKDGQPRRFKPGDSVSIRVTRGAAISGTVTNTAGEPMVALRVKAIRLRDSDGKTVRPTSLTPEEFILDFKTDDRGTYRVWGLEPGTYIVAAGASNLIPFDIEGSE